MKGAAAAAALAAAALVACGGGVGSPANVDAAKVLSDGGAAMAQWKTATATLKLTNGTVSLQGFTLVKAVTGVVLPTDSDTAYTVREQDISISFHVVITGGHLYLQIPLQGFHEATPAEAAVFPDMARLFNAQTGLPAVIPAGSNPRYVSTDQVGGAAAYQIATSYSADQIHGLLAQLNSNGPVAARIWAGVADHQIRKATLSGTFGDGGKSAAVEIDITGFDQPVTITSPTP